MTTRSDLPEYYLRRDGKTESINIDVFTPLPAYSLIRK